MVAACGMSSCISCTRLVTAAVPNRVIPVILPPGRLRLATRPSLTGSPLAVNTIGIVWVAALLRRRFATSCGDYGDLSAYKLGCHLGISIVVTLCPAVFNGHVLALDEAS